MGYFDILIIGGGAAGIAAARAAADAGCKSIALVERKQKLGGILLQCSHPGFGAGLTGGEYTAALVQDFPETVTLFFGTTVLSVEPNKTAHLSGDRQISFSQLILATGSREIPLGALPIAGTRPKGVYTAGQMQEMMNLHGFVPQGPVVILGSGDIGLIMARRMTLGGAKVKVVAELMPYSGGLKRNIVQCLDDFGIPLKLSHTVVNIKGKERVEGITLAEVGTDGRPIPGTEEEYTCDTLLLSVGLIPENELSRGMGVELNPVTSGPKVNESLETNIEGVFACGNVLHVHDLVDFVSEEAVTAGKNAAAYIKTQYTKNQQELTGEELDQTQRTIILEPQNGVRYTVPTTIRPDQMPEELTARFRVGAVYKNCYISCYFNNERILHKKRTILAPGEMEQIKLTKDQILNAASLNKITIQIEED